MIMMPYGWTLAIAAAHRSGGLLAPHTCGHWPYGLLGAYFQAACVFGTHRSPRWAASSDAQLARLSGCEPVPVSSGRTDRHRLALGADAGCVVATARPASFPLL